MIGAGKQGDYVPCASASGETSPPERSEAWPVFGRRGRTEEEKEQVKGVAVASFLKPFQTVLEEEVREPGEVRGEKYCRTTIAVCICSQLQAVRNGS